MGGTYSWLDAVKKALRSPTKHKYTAKTLQARMREEDVQVQDNSYKKICSKRRWMFKKTGPDHETLLTTILHDESNTLSTSDATSATQPITTSLSISFQNHHILNAALVIQTFFRRYLARRAVEALKGVVKLQALVRGQNVRSRTKTTLTCIQALLRVQARVCDQRRRNLLSTSNQQTFYSSTHITHDHVPAVKTFQPNTSTPCVSQNQQQGLVNSSSPTIKAASIFKVHYSTSPRCQQGDGIGSPGYMSATVSAMARQSSPSRRQRIIDEYQGAEKKTSSARKRLSFNVSEKYSSDSEVVLRSSPAVNVMAEGRRRLSMSSSSSSSCKHRHN